MRRSVLNDDIVEDAPAELLIQPSTRGGQFTRRCIGLHNHPRRAQIQAPPATPIPVPTTAPCAHSSRNDPTSEIHTSFAP